MNEQDGLSKILADATPNSADGGALKRRDELTQPVFGALLITGVPPVIFLAMLIPRAVELNQHRPATALTALEILALFVLMAAALIISVIAGAGLKRALVEPPYKRSLWIVGVLQLAVFAQLLSQVSSAEHCLAP